MVTDVWRIERPPEDPSKFNAGRLGPYRLGPALRKTAFGEVILAMHDRQEQMTARSRAEVVVELDVFYNLARTALTAPDGDLMPDLAMIVELRHRHVAPVIGTGLDDEVPYVVRPYRMGRTLAELLARADKLDAPFCAAVLHAVADAAAHLEDQSPGGRAAAMGGFDARDVFLGYDGAIELIGIGLKSARGHPADPGTADLAACLHLAQTLDAFSSGDLTDVVAAARPASGSGLAGVGKALRKRHRAACVERLRLVARELRLRFSDEILADRAFFDLPTLQ